MSEIIDNYVEISFEGEGQAPGKSEQFEFNYRSLFKSGPVLDIGIGRGEMLTCMKDWGYVYNGIDVSPSTVRFCQKLDLRCEVVTDTIAYLNSTPGKYGVVTLLDVLEHIRKDFAIPTLNAVRKSLAPGGIVIIQVPNAQARDGQLHRYNDYTHEFAFVEHSLRQVLMAAGFSDISFFGFETLHGKSLKVRLKKILRSLIWQMVRRERSITGNLNPRILHPVLCAVARK